MLAYRLSCGRDGPCETYAAAFWQPASAPPKMRNPALSLWIRYSPDAEVTLVVKDSGGQTLRFPIQATIEHNQPGAWQFVSFPLAANQAEAKLKGHLTQAGIQVQPRFRADLQGAVSFDEITLHESPETFTIDPSAKPEPPPPEAAALPSRLGVNIHLLRDDPALDRARAAGFSFVRMDLEWSNVERAGRYRFFAYDALLRALDARGMGVLWILDYGHPDHGGGALRTPADIAAFARFAEAVAAHFKGRNVRYEIWNEPDTSKFWEPAANPVEYAALLREALAAIHRADPAAPVSSGGVSRFDVPFLSRALDPALAAGLTAVAIHPYRRTAPESIAADLGVFAEWVARALGKRIEIWDTEWGYSSADSFKDARADGHSPQARRRQA